MHSDHTMAVYKKIGQVPFALKTDEKYDQKKHIFLVAKDYIDENKCECSSTTNLIFSHCSIYKFTNK